VPPHLELWPPLWPPQTPSPRTAPVSRGKKASMCIVSAKNINGCAAIHILWCQPVNKAKLLIGRGQLRQHLQRRYCRRVGGFRSNRWHGKRCGLATSPRNVPAAYRLECMSSFWRLNSYETEMKRIRLRRQTETSAQQHVLAEVALTSFVSGTAFAHCPLAKD